MGSITSLFSRSSNRFEALLAPHIEQLYRIAYRFCGNQVDAEDLVQELLTKLYSKRDQLEKVDPLRPWLVRSLHNLHIDQLRKQMRQNVQPLSDEMMAVLPDSSAGPGDKHAQSQLYSHIDQALKQIAEEQRILIIMHDMEGYKLIELEEMLDIPLGTLKSRLHRARKHLRTLLDLEPFGDLVRIKG